MKVCPYCRGDNADDAVYCESCGSRIPLLSSADTGSALPSAAPAISLIEELAIFPLYMAILIVTVLELPLSCWEAVSSVGSCTFVTTPISLILPVISLVFSISYSFLLPEAYARSTLCPFYLFLYTICPCSCWSRPIGFTQPCDSRKCHRQIYSRISGNQRRYSRRLCFLTILLSTGMAFFLIGSIPFSVYPLRFVILSFPAFHCQISKAVPSGRQALFHCLLCERRNPCHWFAHSGISSVFCPGDVQYYPPFSHAIRCLYGFCFSHGSSSSAILFARKYPIPSRQKHN